MANLVRARQLASAILFQDAPDADTPTDLLMMADCVPLPLKGQDR